MKTRSLFILVACLALAGCGKEPEPTPTPTPTPKDEVKITSASAFTIVAEGGSVTVDFTSSGTWTAALSNDRASGWLSLGTTTGKAGKASLTLTASPSSEPDDRSATVRLTCGNASASVSVTQKQKDALTQTPSKTQFDSDGGTFTILVKSNVEYSFEVSGEGWIHQLSTKALTEKTTTFQVDRNTDTRKREGSVTVVSSLGRETVNVYQEAAAPSIVLTANQVSLGTEGGSFNVEISSNVDVGMSITAGGDWLRETSTKASSTHTYSFSAAPNEGTDPRVGEITFSSSEWGLSEKVTVTQMQKDALVISQSLYEVGADGGNISIEAATNVDLDVRISEPWVRRVDTKSMQTLSYDFSVDSNPGYDVRECVITFEGGENAGGGHSFSQPSQWSVIGTIGGDSWTKDIGMKTDGVWHVAYGISVTSSDEFKFRKDNSWSVNLGASSYQVTTVSEGVAVPLMQDGGNLRIAAGSYDMYLSPAGSKAYFLRSGTPFTFEGYGEGRGVLSQTVTIRQDGADAFLADFQGRYTLSARGQTLDLRARSSVDIEAQSHSDWISVVSTKALSDRTVSLQIAENSASGARTGKVTVSAPALGMSQEVTIVQVGQGDIYIQDEALRGVLLAKFDTDGDGLLSKEECEAVEYLGLLSTDDPSVDDIQSLQGIEYFVNLSVLEIRKGTQGKVGGTVDLSANTKLWGLYMDRCSMDVLDIRTCKNLRTISLTSAGNLKEVVFPQQDGLFVQYLTIQGSMLGPELDLSLYPDLLGVFLRDNPLLKKVWLVTGLSPELALDGGCSVHYKGDNPNVEAQFKDPVLKEVMMNSTYYRMYDENNDGVFSYRELERINTFCLWKEYFDGIDPSKVITSFEDVAMMKNVGDFSMFDLYDRVQAPLPQCLGDLENVDRILISNTAITGPIPPSVCRMDKMLYIDIENAGVTGPLPEDIGTLPNLRQLKLANCPNLDGPIPRSLLCATYGEISLYGCNFDDTYIVVPSSELLDHTTASRNFSYLGGQGREYTIPGGGTYIEYPSIYYRSEVDGHGEIHADGEVELYHSATVGPGLDIFITGDGFTAENNTVGGTLETYMKHLAAVTLSMEPYNKLKEYFNIWLVYAHSKREGTGFLSTEGLKFSSYQPNPLNSTRCQGDNESVSGFVKEATGRSEPSGTVAVVMNSSHYGGTCYFSAESLYEAGMAVGYTPAAWMMDLTHIHETLGHGFGHLDDEYEASGYGGGYYNYMGNYWSSLGFGANVDAKESVRWSSFIEDSRYAGENIGAYATKKYVRGYFSGGYQDYYRPTMNSVMNSQWEEGGNRFNAPSREAIWQRVQILANPEASWSSWEDYVNNGYNREDFVRFDQGGAPSGAPTPSVRLMPPPMRTLPDGRTVRMIPPHTPPVITDKVTGTESPLD